MPTENLLIDVEIAPDALVPGQDADGLPRTDAPAPKPKVKAEPKIDPELETLRREREELQRERDAERQARTRIEAEASRRIDAERKRAEAAEVERDRSTGIASNAHWATLHARHETIEGGLAHVEHYIATAQQALSKALADGDHDAAADLNTKISRANAQLSTFEQGKREIEGEIARVKAIFENARAAEPAKREEEPEVKTSPAKADAIDTPEKWIDQFPRKTTGNWLKANKDFVTDQGKHKELLAFANEYVADYGQHMLHTPAFVEALNAKFKQEQAVNEEETAEEIEEATEEVEVAKPVAKKAVASAPVSRSSSPGKPSNASGKIQLTQDQFTLAPDIYPSYEDLSPETKAKFPAWSPTAARFQYHNDLKRAEKDGKFIPRT